MSSDDRAEIAQRLQRGDTRGAAEQLVRRHAAAVLDLCTAMVRDRTRAEDLTQEIFGKAFAALPDFRGEASPRTWLLRIAKNHCIDALRAHRIEPAFDADEIDTLDDEAPLPPELLARRDAVERALASLGELERALIVLRFKNGLEYDELAHAFGLKPGTVRMRVSRALAKMRAALEPATDALHAGVLSQPLPREAPAPPRSAMTRARLYAVAGPARLGDSPALRQFFAGGAAGPPAAFIERLLRLAAASVR